MPAHSPNALVPHRNAAIFRKNRLLVVTQMYQSGDCILGIHAKCRESRTLERETTYAFAIPIHNQFHPSMCSTCQQMDVLNNKALIHANHMPKVRAFDQSA